MTSDKYKTVAMMAVINDVYDPSLEHYSFHSCLLPARKDVIGLDKMTLLARYAIQDGLERHVALYEQLPEFFVIMRSGVSTGQIPEVQTKELSV